MTNNTAGSAEKRLAGVIHRFLMESDEIDAWGIAEVVLRDGWIHPETNKANKVTNRINGSVHGAVIQTGDIGNLDFRSSGRG